MIHKTSFAISTRSGAQASSHGHSSGHELASHRPGSPAQDVESDGVFGELTARRADLVANESGRVSARARRHTSPSISGPRPGEYPPLTKGYSNNFDGRCGSRLRKSLKSHRPPSRTFEVMAIALARLRERELVRQPLPWRFSEWVLEPAGELQLELLEPSAGEAPPSSEARPAGGSGADDAHQGPRRCGGGLDRGPIPAHRES